MNNTQPPRPTLSSRVERSVIAGAISALVYFTLTGASLLLAPSARDESATYEIRIVTFYLIGMLSIPGFVIGRLGAGVIDPDSAALTGILPAIVFSLLLWFSLGAISAFAFRKNKPAIVMTIVLVGITEILGWIAYPFIFAHA